MYICSGYQGYQSLNLDRIQILLSTFCVLLRASSYQPQYTHRLSSAVGFRKNNIAREVLRGVLRSPLGTPLGRRPTQPGSRGPAAPLKVVKGNIVYFFFFPNPDSCVSENFTIGKVQVGGGVNLILIPGSPIPRQLQ